MCNLDPSLLSLDSDLARYIWHSNGAMHESTHIDSTIHEGHLRLSHSLEHAPRPTDQFLEGTASDYQDPQLQLFTNSADFLGTYGSELQPNLQLEYNAVYLGPDLGCSLTSVVPTESRGTLSPSATQTLTDITIESAQNLYEFVPILRDSCS